MQRSTAHAHGHAGTQRATCNNLVRSLIWAIGYNSFTIPLAAGVAYGSGIALTPAPGAAVISLSTVIVAINAKLPEPARRSVASAERVARYRERGMALSRA